MRVRPVYHISYYAILYEALVYDISVADSLHPILDYMFFAIFYQTEYCFSYSGLGVYRKDMVKIFLINLRLQHTLIYVERCEELLRSGW